MKLRKFVKKALFAFVLSVILISPVVWFGRQQIKRVAIRNPKIAQLIQKVSQWSKATQFGSSSLGKLNENESMQQAHLVVDFDHELGIYKKFWGGLGQNSFNAGHLDAHNKAYYELIGEINKTNQIFEFTHSKGIFCDKVREKREDSCGNVYEENENKKPLYHWEIADKVFDLILANGMRPLVSLTYMPIALASDLKNRNPWNRANVSPPKDYDKWQMLVFETVKHLKERYGADEIKQWYFEVWNEPDLPHLFWVNRPTLERFPYKKGKEVFRGDNLEYFKLYDYSVMGATEANSEIRIGGPAIAGDIQLFINDWLPHCIKGKNFANGQKGGRVDFLSRHAYGSVEDKLLPIIRNFINNAKRHGKEIVENSEFLITEFGPTAKGQTWLNTRYVAAWVVKAIDGIFYLGEHEGEEYVPEMMFFWTKPVPPNFSKHFGLATALGNPRHPSPKTIIKRPAFNAFDALSRLRNMRISVEGTQFGDPIHAVATKDDKSLQILLYHLNESDHKNKIARIYPVDLIIRNLSFTRFEADLYLIDETHSNGFTAWKALGKPEYPKNDQLDLLQKSDDLELVESKHESIASKQDYQRTIQLQNNSVALLVLTKL